MELDWSTFILEIINFLILVWILQRFLYRPVLDIIAKRRSAIQETMTEARKLETEAKALQDQYESRLADWAAEQRAAREAMAREIDEERSRRLAALQDKLAQEREKVRVADQQRLADLRRQYEHIALTQGAAFVARLLQGVASPDLQARLLEQALTGLATLPAERAASLVPNREEPPGEISVASAFALTDQEQEQLRAALKKLTDLDAPVRFAADPALMAGLRITVGAWVLGLNLQDELDGFAQISHVQD